MNPSIIKPSETLVSEEPAVLEHSFDLHHLLGKCLSLASVVIAVPSYQNHQDPHEGLKASG